MPTFDERRWTSKRYIAHFYIVWRYQSSSYRGSTVKNQNNGNHFSNSLIFQKILLLDAGTGFYFKENILLHLMRCSRQLIRVFFPLKYSDPFFPVVSKILGQKEPVRGQKEAHIKMFNFCYRLNFFFWTLTQKMNLPGIKVIFVISASR